MNQKDKLTENTMLALQGRLVENEAENLLTYKSIIEKLLDLTMPKGNRLGYSYVIKSDEIELLCTYGPSGSDMQAINGIEGWANRFAKQITNYDTIFGDDRGWDWYSGMTFSNSGYRTVNGFKFNIYLNNANKLSDVFNKYTTQDLDKQIQDKATKYQIQQDNRLKEKMKSLKFTAEQINLVLSYNNNGYETQEILQMLNSLQKEYTSIKFSIVPLKSLDKVLNKYKNSFCCDEDILYYLYGASMCVDETVLNKLLNYREPMYWIYEKAQKISENNFVKNIKTENPELTAWANSVLKQASLDYYPNKVVQEDLVNTIKAVSRGYSKDYIENVLSFYSNHPKDSTKAQAIKQALLAVMGGKYNLNKSQVQYLVNLCEDWSNIKYFQSLYEIIHRIRTWYRYKNN